MQKDAEKADHAGNDFSDLDSGPKRQLQGLVGELKGVPKPPQAVHEEWYKSTKILNEGNIAGQVDKEVKIPTEMEKAEQASRANLCKQELSMTDGHSSLAGAKAVADRAVATTLVRELPSNHVDALIVLIRAVGVPKDLVSGVDLGGWRELEQHRNPGLCLDYNLEPLDWDKQHEQLLFLFLAESHLSGVLPDIFDVFGSLVVIALASNNLKGSLPTHWPASLKVLLVNDNPELTGVISKSLIVQCDSICYHGCKQQWQCTSEQQEEGTGWMQGPFITGVTFASENISCLLENRDSMGITHDMLKDSPQRADKQYRMYTTHGADWCAWQEVWLSGLRSLRNRKVYIMVGDGEVLSEEQELEELRIFCQANADDWQGEFDRERERTFIKRGGNAWEPKDKGQFKRKFLTKKPDEENTRNCFDPKYDLAEGESAHSILDWERRHMLKVAVENDLQVVYLEANPTQLQERCRPEWYRAAAADTAKLVEDISIGMDLDKAERSGNDDESAKEELATTTKVERRGDDEPALDELASRKEVGFTILASPEHRDPLEAYQFETHLRDSNADVLKRCGGILRDASSLGMEEVVHTLLSQQFVHVEVTGTELTESMGAGGAIVDENGVKVRLPVPVTLRFDLNLLPECTKTKSTRGNFAVLRLSIDGTVELLEPTRVTADFLEVAVDHFCWLGLVKKVIWAAVSIIHGIRGVNTPIHEFLGCLHNVNAGDAGTFYERTVEQAPCLIFSVSEAALGISAQHEAAGGERMADLVAAGTVAVAVYAAQGQPHWGETAAGGAVDVPWAYGPSTAELTIGTEQTLKERIGDDEPPAPAPAPEPAPSDLQRFIKQVVHVSHKKAIAKTADAPHFVGELVERICGVLDADEFEVSDRSKLERYVRRFTPENGMRNELMAALGQAKKTPGGAVLGASKADEFVSALIEAIEQDKRITSECDKRVSVSFARAERK
jgi:hypothetical protein